MRTFAHVLTSAGVGLATYGRYRSVGAALASFLAGFLLDVDHIVDYVHAHGWRPKWDKVSEACHEKYSGKLYLPLHSYELLALFFMLLRRPTLQPFRVGVTISVLTHLLLDQRYNPARRPFTYFLAHRIHKHFAASEILKPRIYHG